MQLRLFKLNLAAADIGQFVENLNAYHAAICDEVVRPLSLRDVVAHQIDERIGIKKASDHWPRRGRTSSLPGGARETR